MNDWKVIKETDDYIDLGIEKTVWEWDEDVRKLLQIVYEYQNKKNTPLCTRELQIAAADAELELQILGVEERYV